MECKFRELGGQHDSDRVWVNGKLVLIIEMERDGGLEVDERYDNCVYYGNLVLS